MNNDVIYPTMVIRSQAETIELQDKEIERLNNIINEYEKWLNELGAWCYVEKLKELKESGNNE